jgi:hypothetical protein
VLAEAALPEESTESTRKVCVPNVVSTGVAVQPTRAPSTWSRQKYEAVIAAVAIVREEHAVKVDAEIPAARAKIAQLIERRARELAADDEDTGRLLPRDVS